VELIDCSLPPNHTIVLAGDSHEGNSFKHYKGYKSMIDYVAGAKDRYLVHMGDMIDSVVSSDIRRYQYEVVSPQSPKPLQQAIFAADELEPIKDKILGIHQGNHEYDLQRFGDFTKDIICKRLDVPYATWSAVYTVTDKKGNPKYKFFCTHGSGSVNSRAKDNAQRDMQLQLSLKKKLEELPGADCSLMAMGHIHKLIVKPPTPQQYVTSSGKARRLTAKTVDHMEFGDIVHEDSRWYIATGSFLKSFELGVSGYAERAMYAPAELGYIKVTVKNYKIKAVEKVMV